jgi:hypothetical protein
MAAPSSAASPLFADDDRVGTFPRLLGHVTSGGSGACKGSCGPGRSAAASAAPAVPPARATGKLVVLVNLH